ncbi:hypothetical protein ACSBR2_040245 [Camellia fascicularis]
METLDTASCGLEMENSSSNHYIVTSIKQMLTCLPRPSPRAENCICRVPRKLRQLKEAAYTPQMVSIGPLHHGETHLKGMEEQKMSVKYVRIQNATALHKTGVKFRVGSSTKCLLDIQFNKGVLEIPHLRITDETEQVLRNIIALEWYLHGQNSYIIDYIVFMDNLIDTPEDVEILEKNEILENWLGDKSAVSNLFNNLTTHVPMMGSKYYFYNISKDLNSYCKVPWHDWKATLKRDYFSSPWRVASTVAAIVFLVLTSYKPFALSSPFEFKTLMFVYVCI